MASKCGACGTNIYSLQYMECSNVGCKKTYDLKCVALQPADFEELSQACKDKWICPECVCLQPKSDNTNTPIRGNNLNNTYNTTTNFVNTQRGSRPGSRAAQDGGDDQDKGNDNQLMAEMKRLRLDIVSRLDEHAEQFELILHMFNKTRSDLQELDRKMGVLEEKLIANIQTPKKVSAVVDLNPGKQQQLSAYKSPSASKNDLTYSGVANINNNRAKHIKNASVVTDKAVATKSPTSPLVANDSAVLSGTKVDAEPENIPLGTENEWKTVSGRRRKQKVMKGESTGLGIQAMEKQKHLHVWRLLPETTSTQVESHVRSVCGANVSVVVEKIKHKTERGYASFIVGVPERFYDTITQASVWPRNTEFSEWVWFRRSSRLEKE